MLPWQGADRALAFCSGMAALSAVLRLVKSGEHVVAGDDLYGGTSRLLAKVTPAEHLEHDIWSGTEPKQDRLL